LDQVRPVVLTSSAGGRARRRVDCENIVAVDANPGKAVSPGPLCDGSGRLFCKRDGNGPRIVLTEKDDRGTKDAGEVHRLVPVALGRGAVAEGYQCDLV